MLDFIENLTQTGVYNQQIFNTPTSTTSTSWQKWIKPRAANFIHIIALGPGGNGAPGALPGGLSSSGGGGAGGSGGYTNILIPAFAIPDILYISVGTPGIDALTAGQGTYVSVTPSSNLGSLIVNCPPGGNGTTPVGGTAGTGGAAGGVFSGAYFSTSAISTAVTFVGQAGAAGSATGIPASITYPTTGIPCTGGNGGGGVPSTAATYQPSGSINSPGLPFPTISGASVVSASSAENGTQVPHLFYFTGAPGGAAASGNFSHKNGGNASIGSGGGGGGGAWTTDTQSTGGKGGDGLVVITWW